MTEARAWYKNERLWEKIQPVLFNKERMEETTKDVDNLLSLTDLGEGAAVLDLCCGIGRHSLELARRGYRVTAVDRTQCYLEQAKDKAAAEGLSIEFVKEDMRRFCRAESFDCVVNLFTSFGYFEDPNDDEEVLSNVHSSLRQGGVFLLELAGKETVARAFQARRWEEHNGIKLLWETKVCKNWSWIENWCGVLTDGRLEEYTVTHRVYSAVELAELVKGCGFETAEVYGGLDGSAYDHQAKRLVVVAGK